MAFLASIVFSAPPSVEEWKLFLTYEFLFVGCGSAVAAAFALIAGRGPQQTTSIPKDAVTPPARGLNALIKSCCTFCGTLS